MGSTGSKKNILNLLRAKANAQTLIVSVIITSMIKESKDLQLKKEYSNVVLAIAGTITSPKDAVKAMAHTVNGAMQGRLLKNFQEAWKLMTEKGAINPAYIESPWAEQQFNEIIRELDKRHIDEQRVEALINVFLNSAQLGTKGIDSLRMVELMKLIGSLDAIDIYILRTLSDLRLATIEDGKEIAYDSSASSWLNMVLTKSELEVLEIIETSESKLMDKRLLSGRVHGDRSGVQNNNNYRLTELGVRVCTLMTRPLV